MKLASSYMMHIRSKDCIELTEGYNTHLGVSLKAPINRAPNQMLHVSLSSAEIPVSWYAISAALKTNQFYIDGAPSLIVPDGNYDIFELETLITADAPFPYSMAYNENTGKVTLSNNDATEHTINFSQTNTRGLAKALGFERDDEVVAAGGEITATGCVNLRTVHSLFLYSSLAIANVITSNQGNYEMILDKIPILVRPFETVQFNPYQTAPFSSMLKDNSIREFQLSLRDQNGNLIQLNDTRFELSILVEVFDHGESTGEVSNKRRAVESTYTPSTSLAPRTNPYVPTPIRAPSYTPSYTPISTQAPTYTAPSAPAPVAYIPTPAPAPQIPTPPVVNQDLSSALLMAKMLDMN